MSVAVAIFARAPIPGACKTRLVPELGADGAAALHAALVEDAIAMVRAIPDAAPELHVAGGGIDHPFFAAITSRFSLPPPIAQAPGGLGERVEHALARAPIVIGSDAPTLPASIVRAAIARLDAGDADVVLAPAADGGYVLIGARAPARFLRAPSIRWSSQHTLADTMRAARSDSLRVALTAPHHDVDTPADLALLATHLALDPDVAPATREALRRKKPRF